jgi:hypothetical protein
MEEPRLNDEHHDNADGAQHDDPRNSQDAPDLMNRKRDTRAEPSPSPDTRLDLIGDRCRDRRNNTPGFLETLLSIPSSLGCVPRSAKGARGSIVTDTTPVSQSRQLGVESVLGCVLT